jgi:Domain of unknown function (DUF4340)
MSTKNTFVWFVVATGLFASILLLNRYLHPPAAATRNMLPGLQASLATSVQLIPAGALEIRADRQGGSWLLTKPVSYPAQSAAIEALLAALQNLAPATCISAGDLHEHRTADADFGFDPPQISVAITAGDQRWQLQVGKKTAPGDQVFLRVVGVDGAFVADADWLKLIPRSANDWRSTALVAADANTGDGIVLTNGAKIIELRRDATNHLWRMIRPLLARADSERINEALQSLQAAQTAQFVSDDPKMDLTAFGLQPADLDLWLNHGTNFISGLHTGKVATNAATLLYARREDWNVVFTTAAEPLSPWRGTVNDFRDPHLLELTAPVAELEVHGPHDFTLQQQGTNDWKVVGENFPVDADNVQLFIKTLAGLRVAEFVKDVVSAPDLAAYGLATPARQITLRPVAADTNAGITQLAFAVQTNGIFVHRADEEFIYAITPEDFNTLFGDGSLFGAGWQFRDRRIWRLNEKDIAQITLRQNGKTRQVVHNGLNKWSLAAGSQGIINPPALEETAHRLGELATPGWVARNVTEPDKFGLTPDNLEITVELKTGEKFSVAFGTELPRANAALAAITVDGERWVFVFPPVLYQFVTSYLTIPANGP